MRTTREPEWTPRQREVLDLLVRGRTNSQIAESLGISLDGAKWHVSEIISRLGVDSRDEAAEYWRHRNGLRMRFTRVAAGLFGSGALKWTAATVFVAGIAAASAMVIFALRESGGDEPAGPGEPPPATATTTPATPASPTPAVTPPPTTGETVAGVGVTALGFTAPGKFPVPLSAVIEKGCYQCDGPTSALERVTLDGSGSLKVEQLFKASSGYISSSYLERGSPYYLTVCSRGYCGGVGQISADAQTTVYRSLDGGVSWQPLETVDGHASVAATAAGTTLLNRSTFTNGTTTYRFQVLGTSKFVEVPAGAEPATVGGKVIGWKLADGKTVQGLDGRTLFTIPDLGGHPAPAYPVGIDAYLPGGEALISWFHGPDPSKFVRYLGVVKGDRLTAVFSAPSTLNIGSWLTASVAFGNVVPDESKGAPLYPVMVDLATGKLTVLELYGSMGGPAYQGERNRIALVEPGPFLRVTGAGDCLNVRESASTTARALGCYADNVILKDLSQEQQAGGVTWRRVETPAGEAGWASAQYLAK